MRNIKILVYIMSIMLLMQSIAEGQANTIIDTRLGIGRTPSAKLDINSASGEDALRVRVNGGTILRVLANRGTTIGGNPGNAPVNGLYVSGNTGFGSTSAIEKVEINGALRLKGIASSNNPQKGTIRWNETTLDFEGYDGTNWKSLTGQPNTNPTTYSVGDFAQGGIVFWVTPGGEHGKVVHLHRLIYDSGHTAGEWSNVYDAPAGASSSTEGDLNTEAIIMQSGHITSAAKLCADLIAEGYDDWYLPARNELSLISDNLVIVNQALNDWGGSRLSFTWTSTEQVPQNKAYWYSVVTESSELAEKSNDIGTRAIRSF